MNISLTQGIKALDNQTLQIDTPFCHIYTVVFNTTYLTDTGDAFIWLPTGSSLLLPSFCEFVNISNCTNTAVTIQVGFYNNF